MRHILSINKKYYKKYYKKNYKKYYKIFYILCVLFFKRLKNKIEILFINKYNCILY